MVRLKKRWGELTLRGCKRLDAYTPTHSRTRISPPTLTRVGGLSGHHETLTRAPQHRKEDEGGLLIACATGFRTHSHASGGIDAPDSSSQVCATDEIQRLGVDDARQTGGVVIPGGRVDSHVLEIRVCLKTCESCVARAGTKTMWV